MVRTALLWICVAAVMPVTGGGAAAASPPAAKAADTVYQVSTINALLEGLYDGVVDCDHLLRHGDTGIGTFDKLDGEMIVLDGKVYQAKADGSVVRVGKSAMSPFAMVTRFGADAEWVTTGAASLELLEKQIRGRLDNPNSFCAIRVDGEFEFAKVRSIPPQNKPYPRLSDAAKEQKVFEARDVAGTLVGYWSPCYVGTMGVPGFHLHFISADRKFGGHLLEVRVAKARVRMDDTPFFDLELPVTPSFAKADLCGEHRQELRAVESDTKTSAGAHRK